MTCLASLFSASGASCDATCTGLGETCFVERMQLIADQEYMDFVAGLQIEVHAGRECNETKPVNGFAQRP